MAHQLRHQRHDDGEGGYTLIELVVAMAIFSAFLAMFVAGIVTVSRAATQARVDAQTSSAVGIAMQRVERSVRYAEDINTPGVVGSRAYVEWRTAGTAASSGVDTCTQLRYDSATGTLAMRTWSAAQTPSSGAWNALLRDVRGTAASGYPFTTSIAAAGVSNYQGLTVHVRAGVSDAAGTETEVTVYAKNSSVDSPSNTLTPAGATIAPVCTATGLRQ